MNPTAEEVRGWSDAQLRLRIAEALGWVKSNKPDDFGFYYIVDKSRTATWLVLNKYDQVMQAKNAPDWPGDLGAAAELISDLKGWVSYKTQDGYYFEINRVVAAAIAPTEARARAEAWYRWWESQNGDLE
jgi:hypothetical protein